MKTIHAELAYEPRKLPSASKLNRARACPGSAVLPQVETSSVYASKGTAVHAFLEAVPTEGRDAALAAVTDEKLRAVLETWDLDQFKHLDRDSFHREQWVSWHPGTDEVKVGFVRPAGEGWMNAKTDLLGLSQGDGAASSAVFIGDWKTGRKALPALASNLQLLAPAVWAARYYQTPEAVVSIIRIHDEGEPYVSEQRLDMFELAQADEELRDLVVAVGTAYDALEVGTQPKLKQGSWCEYCPALTSCPAQMGLVKWMVDAPDEIEERYSQFQLTTEAAPKAYHAWRSMQALMGKITEAITTYARQQDIDIGDGLVYGARPTKTKKLLPEQAKVALVDEFGAEVALRAFDKTSMAAVTKALRPVWEEELKSFENGPWPAGKKPKKPTLKGLTDRASAALNAACAYETKHGSKLDVVKQKKE